MLKKGDIILIKYKKLDLLGWVIRKITHSNYNHVAWAISDTHYLEVVGIGILIRPLKRLENKFLFEIKIRRIKNINSRKLNRAVDYAIFQNSRALRITLWITFILLAIGYKGKRPRLTCSGLIATCLAKVHWYFNQKKKPEDIIPKDIEKCTKLKVLK